MAKRHLPRVQSGPLKSSTSSSRPSFPTKNTPSPFTSSSDGARTTGGKSKLDFREVRGDLFECPETASLVHCVSEDMVMGKGIAKVFKKRFGGEKELKMQDIKTGGVAVLEREGRCIFYLVTKQRYFNKPTYDTIHSSLGRLCELCSSRSITELCMPQIGCGLDRLEWGRVREMIRDTFADSEIAITIYSL